MIPIFKYCEVKLGEPLSLHTSFNIGGDCSIFVTPQNVKGIRAVLNYVNQNKIPLIVIGNGTNILFPDNEFTGVVMRIGEPYFSHFSVLNPQSSILNVGAGTAISTLLESVAEQSLSGLEFMAGIPGTLGGAITMNAGAYGKRIGDVILSVQVMACNGNIYWVKHSDIGFGYRESRFNQSNEIILSAKLKLNKGEASEIKNRIQQVLTDRKSRLPIEFPSAGCVFKNPPNKPAGELIELAGCKGLKVGGAQVSTRHANFIVNSGKATSEDVKTLIGEIKLRVYKKFKISLEPELVIIK